MPLKVELVLMINASWDHLSQTQRYTKRNVVEATKALELAHHPTVGTVLIIERQWGHPRFRIRKPHLDPVKKALVGNGPRTVLPSLVERFPSAG